ncbi:PREDICTED: uncharacterized protein LOC105360889 [Ceratosolen solmsi marchali]|uniref:Uncharacterized protein LOC105360889 n=1 Tax=Ceratosolen solmsi marchali TaxID=326594 RepID=A0AAJ7DTM0_9HYME|nr:PREDICTED: uncharacterized protein LOC105360889 [Ceratosolen solmsi marchali]
MGGSNDIANKYGCSESGGVKVMGIQGRMGRERERMLGMTEAERAWRAKWVKDQILHNEPIIPQNYYKERYNPIRRFYRTPLNKLEAALVPIAGFQTAQFTRHCIAKMGMLILGIYCAHYYMKYNRGNWTSKKGWKLTSSSIALYPGDPDFPNMKEKKPQDYATFGFENSPI